MKKYILLSFLLLSSVSASFAQMQDHSAHILAQNADHSGHAHHQGHSALTPAAITGEHVMAKDDWMMTYSYMSMNMHGNRQGTERVDIADIFAQGFTLAPVDMLMEMHMISAMAGITDETTLMVMLPYVRKVMDVQLQNGNQFSTEAEGVGDIRLMAMQDVTKLKNKHLSHLNLPGQLIAGLGISVPTGRIDDIDANFAGNFVQLPYRMQPGSGTWDLLPQVTWTHYGEHQGFGAQAKAIIRLGENAANYRLGNDYTANVWYSRYVTDALAANIRLEGHYNGNIHGQDARLNPNLAPTTDPNLYKGTRLDAAVGFHWLSLPTGWELMSDIALPIVQNLKGPQMETDWTVTARLRKTF